MPTSDDDVVRAIESGETRRVEFKNPRSLGPKDQRPEVIRAVLAMANRRDGGLVLIGVNNDRTVPGLTPEQAETWRNTERVRQIMAECAQPSVDFDVTVRPLTIGGALVTIAVIEVREFEEFPIVCTATAKGEGGKVILRDGATYVRNLVPASVEIEDHAQMRELLDLAIEKGVRRFLGTAARAGLVPRPAPDHNAQFERQREGFDE